MDNLNNQNEQETEDSKTPFLTGEDGKDIPQRISPRYKNFIFIISPVSAAFIGLIGALFLYQVLGGLLTVLVLGFDIPDAPINSQRLMTAAGQILFILLPGLILSRVLYKDVGYIIRAKVPGVAETALFLLGIIVLTPLLQNFLYIQNHFIDLWAANNSVVRDIKLFFDSMNKYVEETYNHLLGADNIFEGTLVVFVVALVPAVCEEVMFRGFIQKSFELKIRPFRAALITAVFFGIYHFNPYGLIPLIGLGLYFGFAAYMSNSILVPVILHFFNNFTAVILYFMYGSEDLIKNNVKPETDIGYPVISFFVLLFIFGSIILLIKRYYLQLKTE
jgi:membrane protease YdiL (CAAX protease family)